MANVAMNPQVRHYGTPILRKTAAGWVGSKAAKRGDIITLDSNGKIDQAAAVSNEVSTSVPIGIANQKIGSGVALSAERALGFGYISLTDLTVLEMKVVTDSDVEVTVTAAMVGDSFSIYRTTDGFYAANTADTLHLVCVGVDLVRNTGFFKVQQAKRIAA